MDAAFFCLECERNSHGHQFGVVLARNKGLDTGNHLALHLYPAAAFADRTTGGRRGSALVCVENTSLALAVLTGHDVRRDVLRLFHNYNRQNEGSIRRQTPFSSRLWK